MRDQNVSGLSKTGMHNVSGQSLIGSSGEYHPPTGMTHAPRAPSNKLEESTVAFGRPPQHVEGLTAFLRKEYYRRMGIYLNGGRKEEGLLLNFWKDNVSHTYKALKEQKA